MKWAAEEDADYTAWLWGVNGAASVCASVLAMIISMTAGIGIAWWAGVGTYLVAAVVLMSGGRGAVAREEPKAVEWASDNTSRAVAA
jgi:hypothetical protein